MKHETIFFNNFRPAVKLSKTINAISFKCFIPSFLCHNVTECNNDVMALINFGFKAPKYLQQFGHTDNNSFSDIISIVVSLRVSELHLRCFCDSNIYCYTQVHEKIQLSRLS